MDNKAAREQAGTQAAALVRTVRFSADDAAIDCLRGGGTNAQAISAALHAAFQAALYNNLITVNDEWPDWVEL